MTNVFTLLAGFSFLGWLYLTFFQGRFWQLLLPEPSPAPDTWPSVDIIVPARNEAEALPLCLPSLLGQDYPGTWRVLLVDDHSTDNTAELARGIAARKNAMERLKIIAAPEKPADWSGKVAAMQAGVAQSTASYILFTDADIWHPPDSLQKLVARATEQKLDLVSRMVKLHCVSAAERLLIPAFVFFFAMLYPFRRANDADSSVAAAAGGVMLVRREALDNAGGLAQIKSALIDDCALARLIKSNGGNFRRTELTLSQDIRSLRDYPGTGDIWQMVARSAFTQLRHSALLLAGTVIGMGLLFLMPLLAIIFGNGFTVGIGLLSWLVMALLYMPMVGFYRLPRLWAFTLPFAAFIYIGATIDSARLYWQGKGGQWKGRAQA